MAWWISFTPAAQKHLGKLEAKEARRIISFLRERAAVDPRASGGQLKGQLGEFWRRIAGDYRILAGIEDESLLILVVRIVHRRHV